MRDYKTQVVNNELDSFSLIKTSRTRNVYYLILNYLIIIKRLVKIVFIIHSLTLQEIQILCHKSEVLFTFIVLK